MTGCADIGTRSAMQGRVEKAIAHMQKGNRMTLKDADKIKEAIKNSDDFVGGSDDIIKVIDSVPEVVINTDTDTISRQAAIETVMDCYDNAELFEVYEEKLRELPPTQPESDSGRWERHCSKCGYKTDYQYANVNHHYCPHCGRKMEREVSNE